MPSLFWGFRLTIWNVNLSASSEIAYSSRGFRLTIWNVNLIYSWENGYKCGTF
ncbi:TPA: hypothetical protein ACSRE6_003104 [Clostridioides difficile]|uniref:hypothetical protein n=1 Tax=Clostridioides difficile TaxID=1496 RepID=UPI003AB8C3EF